MFVVASMAFVGQPKNFVETKKSRLPSALPRRLYIELSAIMRALERADPAMRYPKRTRRNASSLLYLSWQLMTLMG
ncbi:hypothetical protein CIHG_10377 [Coccidioides immitis H538.4]|uniref:Uncharacterized protein n=1 Tax=Coccidioides immitis H538.4 TaxID=396776 RepID=A0A0J8S5Y5_COCIT|nr:hypothetical protein CIHG_10377 [Coccidioides immitis H538.4]